MNGGRPTANIFLARPLGPCGGVKRSNIIKLQLQSQFQRFFIPNFVCVFSQIKDIKHERNFHSVPCVMPQRCDFVFSMGVKNLSAGICDGTPSTARSCFSFTKRQFIKFVGLLRF